MEYEKKKEALEIFKVLNWDRPWSDEYREAFRMRYRALAAAITKPIQKRIAESELRKTVTVKELELGEDPPAGQYLPSLGSWGVLEETFAFLDFIAAWKIPLDKVTPENLDKCITYMANAIINCEIEAVNIVKDAADTDDVVIYVRKPMEAYEDPYIIKGVKIGFYGWEEAAIGVSRAEN